jgi:hypothetical protein
MSGEKVVHPGSEDRPVSALLGADYTPMEIIESMNAVGLRQEREIAWLRADNQRLRKSLQWLSLCAQTSGGVAGPDFELMQAVGMAEAVLADGPKGQDGPVSGPGTPPNSHPGEGQ